MIAFTFPLLYDPGTFSVIANDTDFLLSAAEGSSIFEASDTLPDSDGKFTAAAVDTGLPGVVSETGPGVLARLSIAANDGATPGVYHLVLDPPGAAHVDPQNDGHVPQSLNHAVVAIDSGCPTEQPEPSFPPGPTQTPGPTTSAPGGTTTPRTSPHTPTNTPATAPTSTPTPTPPATPTPPPDQPIPTPTPAGLPATGGNGPSASGELPLIGFALAILVLAGVALQGATNAPKK